MIQGNSGNALAPNRRQAMVRINDGVLWWRMNASPCFNVLTLTAVNVHIWTRQMLYRILTHWGRVTHICVSKLTIIILDNGLSPGRRQSIIWTNAGILLIRPLEKKNVQWNLNQNSYIFIQENAFEIVVWKMSAILSRPQCVKYGCLIEKAELCLEKNT